MHFKEAIEPLEDQTWHCLVWQSGDDGYDRMALCPEKDYAKAFFTIQLGQWSEPAQHDFIVRAMAAPKGRVPRQAHAAF